LLSFEHAWNGLEYAVRTQRNFRIQVAAAVGALALGFFLRLSDVEVALVLVTIVLVLAAELFNTVVEALVDLVTEEYDERARIAKDVAAGAVLLCALFAVVIGCLVYIPHVWALFAGQ
jgi:diacylglycerol kinase